ncbi:MAG: DUF1738 domain-containing protein [Bacteroides sp.]|nr:DUF1738 domain-containing protein [Bacteroides sp.]
MKKNESNREQVQQRRAALKDLSSQLQALSKQGLFPEFPTVNGLLRYYYESKGYKDLKTFKQWKKDGFSVKKGEKAILLWAQPVASSQSKESAAEAGKTVEEAKEDYFPVCHVFAACQVQPMKNN